MAGMQQREVLPVRALNGSVPNPSSRVDRPSETTLYLPASWPERERQFLSTWKLASFSPLGEGCVSTHL
ncbi:hypothetical protein WG66_002162 [Moniliophthora roreri]|nr:hypothetical protein WG66_002162 [Moniliophthora roreri]